MQDLDARIAALEGALATLKTQRAEREAAAFLLVALQVVDTWFTAGELCTLAALAPALDVHLAGASPKAVGRRLKQIADAQDRSGAVPALRLVRSGKTNRGVLWKIESHQPSGGSPDLGG